MTIRRAALEAVGGYRFRYASEDYDLWLRLSEQFDLATVPEPVILLRLHLGQVSVRRLETQIRDGLVVRAAAHARRAIGVDPLAGIEELSPWLLDALNVEESELRSELASELIARGAILADLGHREEADELVTGAARLLGSRAARAFAATTELKQADALLQSNRRVGAARHVLRAMKREPRHTCRLLAMWLGPRVYAGRIGR
jgi:hypothetical protein